jgi:cytochrome c-type biogenesis protein CcmH/NrfG
MGMQLRMDVTCVDAQAVASTEAEMHARERELWRLRARGLRAEARADVERRTRPRRLTESAEAQTEQVGPAVVLAEYFGYRCVLGYR